ncbi:MAG: site-specific DNA-methyltransferase [Treponema sp.]
MELTTDGRERVAWTLEECEEKKIGQGNPEHWFIEGDNLPALGLLQARFAGEIGIVYIDPPYNTGKSFTFGDSDFAEGDGVRTVDERKNGDRHGAWLSFMKKRLLAARGLLRPDGCIFIAIGQEELYRLKILCDEVFGEDNFVNDFMWLHGKGKKDRWSRTMQQSNLCYARDKKHLRPFCGTGTSGWAKTNADGDERGKWFSGSVSFSEARSNPLHRNFYEVTSPSGRVWRRQWLVSREEMEKLLLERKIYFGSAPDYAAVPRVKIFDGEESAVIPKNIIEGAGTTRSAQRYVDSLLGGRRSFDNPKPVELVRRLIAMTRLPKDAAVLDFFAGSGTTFEAVIKQNELDGGERRCILIQKKEAIKRESKYADIAELCYERVRLTLNGGGSVRYFGVAAGGIERGVKD